MIKINKIKILSIAMAVLYGIAAILLAYALFSHNTQYALPFALIFLCVGNIIRSQKLKQSDAVSINKGSYIVSFIGIILAILMLVPANIFTY